VPDFSDLEGRIPAGSISVAAGPEGVGKSSFGTALAARVSKGTLTGAWYGIPKRVLYVAVEDSWEQTLVPRLMAAGANLAMIGRVEVVIAGDETTALSLPADNRELERVITEHDVGLVVLDPMLSVISDRIDTHREREVRNALDPLAALADRTGIVLLGIAHWNKGTGSDVSARITGSGAFKNVPRSVFGFVRDQQSDTNECVMSQAKNSLGRFDLPSLRYRIEGVDIDTPAGVANTGKFVVCGESDKSVTQILGTAGKTPAPNDTDEEGYTPAQRFIITYLLEEADGYETRSRVVIDAGKKSGYTEKELVKARNGIKHEVLTRKIGTVGDEKSGWMWRLNPEGEHAPARERINNTTDEHGESE
jgi:hypothetical protein